MKKPSPRMDFPPRRNDNQKRRLLEQPDLVDIEELIELIRYEGSPKHKSNPSVFGLEKFRGTRGDATLCDAHTGFGPGDMASILPMIHRGLRAGLVGKNDLIWAISDVGWIFEGRITNREQHLYHGYPVRPSEAIAEPVYERFRSWAENKNDEAALRAAGNCKYKYRL